jgi:hypothetical protein
MTTSNVFSDECCTGNCNQGRNCPFRSEDHTDEMLAWLLPFAITVLSVSVISACAYFGWLR